MLAAWLLGAMLLAVRETHAIAIDCMADRCGTDPAGVNYVGVRYKATLIEDSLPKTGWVLLFNGSGFTSSGEYQPHFFEMMIKAGEKMAAIYKDGLCPTVIHEGRTEFGFEFGLSDYEDPKLCDNDIGMWSHDPDLFPRTFANIDSANPDAADKAEAEYQVDRGGPLKGREIEVSFERGKELRLARNKNYFMDADNGGEPCSQADILYRHWVATFSVPSEKIKSVVDVYVNATQGEYIRSHQVMNVMWENPGRIQFETDKYKVVMYDFEAKTISGKWVPIRQFLVDFRGPKEQLPLDQHGNLVGGFRRSEFKGRPALEASFGYGYTDYAADGDPTQCEKSSRTMGVISMIPSRVVVQ